MKRTGNDPKQIERTIRHLQQELRIQRLLRKIAEIEQQKYSTHSNTEQRDKDND
jgi:hypothetical protein